MAERKTAENEREGSRAARMANVAKAIDSSAEKIKSAMVPVLNEMRCIQLQIRRRNARQDILLLQIREPVSTNARSFAIESLEQEIQALDRALSTRCADTLKVSSRKRKRP